MKHIGKASSLRYGIFVSDQDRFPL